MTELELLPRTAATTGQAIAFSYAFANSADYADSLRVITSGSLVVAVSLYEKNGTSPVFQRVEFSGKASQKPWAVSIEAKGNRVRGVVKVLSGSGNVQILATVKELELCR